MGWYQRRVHGVPATVLPSPAVVAAACTLPTCTGFWKTGYAVSYGYGGAMLASGALTLPHATGLAKAHALIIALYGIRLILFLLYREVSLPEAVHQMRRRDASVPERLKRAPVILGCSFLYFCMAAPLRITTACSVLFRSGAPAAVAVVLVYLGFGVAAVGDLVKSWVKARQGADTLVTVGPFRRLRHPNYTGEVFGWTASFAAACLAVASAGSLRNLAAWLAIAACGAA